MKTHSLFLQEVFNFVHSLFLRNENGIGFFLSTVYTLPTKNFTNASYVCPCFFHPFFLSESLISKRACGDHRVVCSCLWASWSDGRTSLIPFTRWSIQRSLFFKELLFTLYLGRSEIQCYRRKYTVFLFCTVYMSLMGLLLLGRSLNDRSLSDGLSVESFTLVNLRWNTVDLSYIWS